MQSNVSPTRDLANQTKPVIALAKRFAENPLLAPQNVKPSREGMTVECLLNPGVFRFGKKTWLLIRVAERPAQKEGFITLPVYDEDGEIKILEFEKSDPDLDCTDPRVVRYKGTD